MNHLPPINCCYMNPSYSGGAFAETSSIAFGRLYSLRVHSPTKPCTRELPSHVPSLLHCPPFVKVSTDGPSLPCSRPRLAHARPRLAFPASCRPAAASFTSSPLPSCTLSSSFHLSGTNTDLFAINHFPQPGLQSDRFVRYLGSVADQPQSVQSLV